MCGVCARLFSLILVFYMEDASFTVNKNQIALVYVIPVAYFLQIT